MTDEELKAQFAQIVELITSTKESLERQIAQVDERLLSVERRLDRQAGLIQTGARQIVRFTSWSERVDTTLGDLTRRVQALEEKRNGSDGRK